MSRWLHVNAQLGHQPEKVLSIGVPPERPKKSFPPPRQSSAAIVSHEQQQDHTFLFSIKDMFESDIEIDTDSQQNTLFSSAQHFAIEEITSNWVNTTSNTFSSPVSIVNPLASKQTSCTLGKASPFGLLKLVYQSGEQNKQGWVRWCFFAITRQLGSVPDPWDPPLFGWIILRSQWFPCHHG